MSPFPGRSDSRDGSFKGKSSPSNNESPGDSFFNKIPVPAVLKKELNQKKGVVYTLAEDKQLANPEYHKQHGLPADALPPEDLGSVVDVTRLDEDRVATALAAKPVQQGVSLHLV